MTTSDLSTHEVPAISPERFCDTLQWNWSDKKKLDRCYCLVCIHPVARLGEVIKLQEGELLIGRDPQCELELADESVSRRHAVLRPTGSSFEVVDLNSTNGTFVNELRVEAHELEPSDRLRFGNQIFKFLSPDRFEADYFEQAYRMMTTDGLTQAHNKRYLFDVAERELRRARRTSRPVSVLMIDIDHFKSINDTHGHLAGDEVLIELSRRLRLSLRGDEVFARYGGEEFCVFMPDTGLEFAMRAGERLRQVVGEPLFSVGHVHLPVTVSVGVASSQRKSNISAAELIELADRQLYAAKRAGRNRVVG